MGDAASGGRSAKGMRVAVLGGGHLWKTGHAERLGFLHKYISRII